MSDDYKERYKLLVQSLREDRVKLDQPLADYTYTKSGIVAECFYIATTQREFMSILEMAQDLQLPITILGAGTKLLDSEIKGLVVKNRTSAIKIGGIKGKVGREGIGIQEALIDSDSGNSIQRINDYLTAQKLQNLNAVSTTSSTIGGALFYDFPLQQQVEKIKVWENGGSFEIDSIDLKKEHIILSVIFKVKAAS